MNKLNDQQKQNIELHVKEKLRTRICPICSANAWVSPDAVYELRELNAHIRNPMAILPLPASVIPVVPMTCSNCGYILFFNAIHVKAIEIGARDYLLGNTTL